MTVWKVPLEVTDVQTVSLPFDWTCLLVDGQRGQLTMWVKVSENTPHEDYLIAVTGTGHPVPPMAEHLGSCQVGTFVWHVWAIHGKEGKRA
jgi:hypothetical protein